MGRRDATYAEAMHLEQASRYVRHLLARAREEMPEGEFNFHRVSASRTLPQRARTWTKVLCHSVLQYVSEAAARHLCREMRRIVKRGGRIVIADVPVPFGNESVIEREAREDAPRHTFYDPWTINAIWPPADSVDTQWMAVPGYVNASTRFMVRVKVAKR